MIDFKKEALKYREEAINLLSELISFKTVLEEFNPNSEAPFGVENKKALEFILEKAKQDGFITKNVDNYAGHIEFGSGKELLGVLAHLDVVPVDEKEWNSDPFKLHQEENKLYGRGTEDDKGPLVAAYLALKLLKANNVNFNKKVRLILGCDEESGSRCLEHYFKYEQMPDLGFSPDAEFPVIYGEKANASYDIFYRLENDILDSLEAGTRYNIVPAMATMTLKTDLKDEFLTYLKENNYKGEIIGDKYIAYGIASHAMCPQNGLNAISILMKFLAKTNRSKFAKYYDDYLGFDSYGKKLGIAYYDEDMKDLTMNVAIAEVNAGVVRIGLNFRIPKDNYYESIEAGFIRSFNNDEKFSFKVIDKGELHFVDKDSFLVKSLMKAYQEITGDYESKPFTIGGGTYAKFIKECVAFGPQMPGAPDVCHIANEFINIDDFVNSIAVYAKAIYELVQ